MPLSDHEQHILDEIEKRLAQEDPRLVEQVGRTSLYSHLARRIRLAAVAFFVGFFLIFLVGINVVVAAAGFIVMVLAALLIYRYLKQLGRDQLRLMQQGGRFSMPGLLARIATRLRPPSAPSGD